MVLNFNGMNMQKFTNLSLISLFICSYASASNFYIAGELNSEKITQFITNAEPVPAVLIDKIQPNFRVVAGYEILKNIRAEADASFSKSKKTNLSAYVIEFLKNEPDTKDFKYHEGLDILTSSSFGVSLFYDLPISNNINLFAGIRAGFTKYKIKADNSNFTNTKTNITVDLSDFNLKPKGLEFSGSFGVNYKIVKNLTIGTILRSNAINKSTVKFEEGAIDHFKTIKYSFGIRLSYQF